MEPRNLRGGFPRGPNREEQPPVAFVQGQHCLAVGAAQQRIGFPVLGELAVGGHGGPLGQRAPEADQGGRTPAFVLLPAPF